MRAISYALRAGSAYGIASLTALKRYYQRSRFSATPNDRAKALLRTRCKSLKLSMEKIRPHKFLTAPTSPGSSPVIFWLSLSLTVATIYAVLALQKGLSAEYIVQDDARQHVFWMQRFVDPQLFPNDYIADYFQSVAPAGYAGLYWIVAKLGITPLLLHKLLPVFLGAIATVYCFGVAMQLLPVPIAGFFASLLLNQSLWMQDGLISATPKAFVYPLFLPFLYYFVKQNLLGTSLAIALLGLFYPQYVFIAAGILVLHGLNLQKRSYRFSAINLAVCFLVLLPYALSASEFGPTISLEQAKALPEFLSGGRSEFFIKDFWKFWFHGRSGIKLSAVLTPAFMAFGFLLPVLLKFPHQFPLARTVSQRVSVLIQLLISSLTMFFAAHLLLFELHLPSRYTQHSLRILMALAAAIALTLLLDSGWRWAQKPRQKAIAFPVAVFLFAALLFYPQWAMNNFPWTYYQVGEQPQLYAFFQQQPKDILIASLSEEANNLPTFAKRSVLTAREYAIPYHFGYYQQFRDRTQALIRAQYSPNLAEVQQFVQQYGVDLWSIDKGAFTPGYLAYNNWLTQYPATTEAIALLEAGKVPAITTVMDVCTVFETDRTVVLNAQCIARIVKDENP